MDNPDLLTPSEMMKCRTWYREHGSKNADGYWALAYSAWAAALASNDVKKELPPKAAEVAVAALRAIAFDDRPDAPSPKQVARDAFTQMSEMPLTPLWSRIYNILCEGVEPPPLPIGTTHWDGWQARISLAIRIESRLEGFEVDQLDVSIDFGPRIAELEASNTVMREAINCLHQTFIALTDRADRAVAELANYKAERETPSHE